MVRKAEAARPPTSGSSAELARAEQGFALIEVVCALAMIGLLAAIILPAFPRGTSRARLEAYAVETAAILKGDRNAARRSGSMIATQVSAEARLIRSGSTSRTLRLPLDVSLETLLAARCAGRAVGSTIDFLPSGMSCGGVIVLTGSAMKYEVRVNWLTGGIDVVPQELL